MSHSFKLKFKYRFEAAHRLTHAAAPSCQTPHGHTWYATAVFEAKASGVNSKSNADLNSDDMVMEFSALKSAWKSFIQETVDHSFLHHYADPVLPALRDHVPEFRGLPFPGDPTTEMIAALFFAKLVAMNEALACAVGSGSSATGSSVVMPPTPKAVIIRETPTNTVVFTANDERAMKWAERYNERFTGWWQNPDPKDRSLRSSQS